MMERKYADFFNIDQDYFPAATEELINKGVVDWKKFYPHETFIKLIKDAITVLSRKQKLSIWVEGAYGTGKSHAVLTLDKLLTCSEEETRAYFDDYECLKDDLLNELIGIKKQEKIITVRRYSASSIMSDNDLIIAIQESILAKLKELNISNVANTSFKDSIIEWLSVSYNQIFFNEVINSDKHRGKFDVDAQTFLESLKNAEGEILTRRINQILDISEDLPQSAVKLTMSKLIEWIKGILEHEEVGSIFFIWDEFTEYFINNKNRLTGFQELIEMTATNKFYMCIVTHKSYAILDDKDTDKAKILGRFLNPTCIIELPDNMAFELMSQAMQKTDNTSLLEEWKEVVKDLEMRTGDSRVSVENKTKIDKKVLSSILPIHPFSALYLKYIATLLSSNQRSMFDFIKNNRGEGGIKGLPWYLENYGPYSDEPILTVDMLWEFVYELGKGNLSRQAEYILNNYNLNSSKLTNEVEHKVLKAVLLLQALSEETRNDIPVLIPNEENIRLAFNGSAIDTSAVTIADNLVNDKRILSKSQGKNSKYTVLQVAEDSGAIERTEVKLRDNFKLSTEIADKEFESVLKLSLDSNARYTTYVATIDDLDKKISNANGKTTDLVTSIIFTVAKDENEAVALQKKILEKSKINNDLIFIDASMKPLGLDDFNQYITYKANAEFNNNKDKKTSENYLKNAKDILVKWKMNLSTGDFKIYSSLLDGKRVNLEGVHEELRKNVNRKYNKNIDSFSNKDTLFRPQSFKIGAKAGIDETNHSFFDNAFLENFKGAIGVKDYWKNDDDTLAKPVIKDLKIAVEEKVQTEFEQTGRVSVNSIYEVLKDEPFGFLPIAMSAYTIGFLLKEYSSDEFSWSDGLNTRPMNIEVLSEAIDSVLKQNINVDTSLKGNKEYFIVKMTDKEKSFLNTTVAAFNSTNEECASIEKARDTIRNKMKVFKFPIFYLKEILANETNLKTPINVIETVIDNYVSLASVDSINGTTTEVEYANKIGDIASANKDLVQDLKFLFNAPKCTEGMKEYFKKYNNGTVYNLSEKLNIINPIEVLKDKVKEDATWLWKSETIDEQIEALHVEFRIIDTSNYILNSQEKEFKAILQRWIDKTNSIKIPYDVTKNEENDLNDVLAIVYNIKKTNEIKETDKKLFAENLELKADSLIEYYSELKEMFMRVNKSYIGELSIIDCDKLYSMVGNNVYSSSAENYFELIREYVKNIKASNGKELVKQLWEVKTNSNSPNEWSETHQMPIECVFEDNDYNDGKMIIDIFNKADLSDTDIETYNALLESNTSLSKIADKNYLDERFRKTFLSEYNNILTDVEDVKNYLIKSTDIPVTKWYSNPTVKNKIKEHAEYKYKANNSYSKASEVVDKMSELELKEYLKHLIEDDIKLGMKLLTGK